MDKPKEWGRTAYDDLLKKYRIPKGQLYYILSEPNLTVVARKLKKSTEGLRQIRKRYAMIVDDYKRRKK